MKIFLLFLLFLASCNTTIEKIDPIKNRISQLHSKIKTSIFCKNFCKEEIILVDWDIPTAFMAKGLPYIWITRGMLTRISDDELVFILAHEHSHHILNHNFKTSLKEKRFYEIEADIYALQIVYCIEFINIKKVLSIYDKLSTFLPDAGQNTTHPSFATRTWHLKMYYKIFYPRICK